MLSHYHPNVNFQLWGRQMKPTFKFKKQISNNDCAVHRIDDGSRHRGLRF